MKLIQPESYLNALPEVRAKIVNGCGPGGWKLDIVPDNILGLDITECCDTHDWEYIIGETEEDKDRADLNLLCNILITINNDDFLWILKDARRKIALKYYEAVSDLGGKAFWKNKVRPV